MTPRQKVILVVLGILDLAVIAGMGVAILTQTTQRNSYALPPASGDDQCARQILQWLAPIDGQVKIAWSANMAQIVVDYNTVPSALSDGDLLWGFLDSLPHPLPSACTVPQTATIHVQAPRRDIQTVRIQGPDLVAWLSGAESDAELTSHAQYRLTAH